MDKLKRLGFDISVSEVFSPAPAAVAVLKERGFRPHLLVYDGNALNCSRLVAFCNPLFNPAQHGHKLIVTNKLNKIDVFIFTYIKQHALL